MSARRGAVDRGLPFAGILRNPRSARFGAAALLESGKF